MIAKEQAKQGRQLKLVQKGGSESHVKMLHMMPTRCHEELISISDYVASVPRRAKR